MERYLGRPTITHPYSASRRLESIRRWTARLTGCADRLHGRRVDSSTKCAFQGGPGICAPVLRSLVDWDQDQIARTYRYSRVDDPAINEAPDRMLVFDAERRPFPGSWDLRARRNAHSLALSEAASGRNLDRRLRHGVLRRSRLVSTGRRRGGSTDVLWSYYGNVHRPHDFSCRDFQLCGDGDFLGPCYTWHTSSDELSGTQAGENGELERVEICGTLHHMRLPFLRTAGRGRLTFIERITGRKRR